jgi:hypothetical protein
MNYGGGRVCIRLFIGEIVTSRYTDASVIWEIRDNRIGGRKTTSEYVSARSGADAGRSMGCELAKVAPVVNIPIASQGQPVRIHFDLKVESFMLLSAESGRSICSARGTRVQSLLIQVRTPKRGKIQRLRTMQTPSIPMTIRTSLMELPLS